MFERSPFLNCPACGISDVLGILSAGGLRLVRRCKRCRYRVEVPLPIPDKKVIYLDQLAISEIFKVKSKTRRPGASNEELWLDIEREVQRTFLLQQAIFPASSIHRNETLVSPFANELTLAHEMLAGDVSLSSVNEIAMLQTTKFAEAFIVDGRPARIDFHVDEILKGKRNEWVADMHINANFDYSAFAESTRSHRDALAAEFIPLFDSWTDEKPTFDEVLKSELESYGTANRGALRAAIQRASEASQTTDVIEYFDKISHPVMEQFMRVARIFESCGLSKEQARHKVFEFWDWTGNQQLPVHRISAYLFAALARKISSGQRRRPSKGMMNDFDAISCYGPYVDAMFLDNECAQLLSERPLSTDLPIKAKIFSTNSGRAFIEYLRDLQNNASEHVRQRSAEIYGISP